MDAYEAFRREMIDAGHLEVIYGASWERRGAARAGRSG